MSRSFLSVEDAGLEEKELSRFKSSVIGLAQKSFGVTIAFFGFTFPWISMDAYVGLNVDSMLLYGALSAAAFLLAYAMVLYFVNASLLKKEVYTLRIIGARHYKVFICRTHETNINSLFVMCAKQETSAMTG